MIWYEIRLRKGAHPIKFYRALKGQGFKAAHHFMDEPWWPGAYVIRIQTDDPSIVDKCEDMDHVIEWDAGPDEEHYGDMWPWVSEFFTASSMINSDDPKLMLKLVHCVLNAHGMSERAEARFALGLLFNRLTIKYRLKWRARRSAIGVTA